MYNRTRRRPQPYRNAPFRKPYSKNYGAAQRSKTTVVTKCRTSNSANRVGAGGLTRISTGIFRDLPTLWPDRLMVKLKYVDTINNVLTLPASGISIGAAYKVNSLWDPLYGNDPNEANIAGYATLISMYNNYRVHASKITSTLTYYNPTVPSLLAACCYTGTPLFNTSTFNYQSLAGASGNPFAVYAELVSGATDPVVLENYVSNKKLTGLENYATEDDYAGVVRYNPTRQLYAYVIVAAPSSPASTTNITMITEIELWAEMYGRNFVYN